MNWYSALYWFTRLDSLNIFICLVAIVAMVCFIIPVIYNVLEGNDIPKKWISWTFGISLFFWLLFIFTPSKKDAAIIVCGGAIGTYLQKDTTIRQIPKEVLDYIRIELKSAVSEAKDEIATNNVKKDLKEQILFKLRNSENNEALNMLKDSTVQKLLRD